MEATRLGRHAYLGFLLGILLIGWVGLHSAEHPLERLCVILILAALIGFAFIFHRRARIIEDSSEVKRQKETLQLILDSLADGVAVADQRGTLVAINRTGREILKSDAQDLPPNEWASHYGIFLPDQVTPYPADAFPLSRAVRGERVNDVEEFLRRPDLPDGLWLSVNARPLIAEDGTSLGAVTVFRDITARKKTEGALRSSEKRLKKLKDEADASNRAKSEFLAAMSHELRTPLNSIIGFSELLVDQKFGPLNDKQGRYVGNILESGRHLLKLINDILDLAKVEAGKVELSKDKVDVAAAVANVRAIVTPMASQKTIALHVINDPNVERIQADESKFKQILFNLLTNAIKFTPPEGTITVATSIVKPPAMSADEGLNGLLRVRVSDTGIGIKPEHHEVVFERFRQIDSSYARLQQGTGLGLALCRQLAELHGGRLSVESEGVEGKGSTFILDLPITQDTSRESLGEGMLFTRASVGETQGGNTAKPRPLVLIVEDNDAAYEILSESLADKNHETTRASDGADAIQKVRELMPDLIVLDIGLPMVDGLDVLTILKNDATTQDIPVVIVSVTERHALPLGIDVADWLVKPVDRDRLASVVAKTLAPASAARPSILLVEDDSATREVMTELLQGQGYEVRSAVTGEEALYVASQRRPDLVLLDLIMPGIDGFVVANALGADPSFRNVPIIAVTAKSLSAAERSRLERRARAIIAKGNPTDVLEEVRKALGLTSRPMHALAIKEES